MGVTCPFGQVLSPFGHFDWWDYYWQSPGLLKPDPCTHSMGSRIGFGELAWKNLALWAGFSNLWTMQDWAWSTT